MFSMALLWDESLVFKLAELLFRLELPLLVLPEPAAAPCVWVMVLKVC